MWLVTSCAAVGALAGTVHRRRGALLELTAAHNIPPAVVERTRAIPRGKGMAGLAWQRAAPVSTCDLQTEPNDDVRPGARAVDAGQAVALPVFGDGEEAPIAVVGFAFRDPGDFDAERLARLARMAATLVAEPGG